MSRDRIDSSKPEIGILEWFRPGEYERVEQILSDLKDLKVAHLRTGLSWADWHTAEGQNWYAWLLPRLARSVEVLPCFHYTPPSLGIQPKTSAPPCQPKAFADFLDQIVSQFGDAFEWVELWNEPNNLSDWDWRLDPQWKMFSKMIGGAAYWMHQRGKKTVLAGMMPIDPNWLLLMAERGVLAYIDAIGVHGFPGTWEFDWQDWQTPIAKIEAVLEQCACPAEIWITEAGFSTWKHGEYAQLKAFTQAIAAPVQRIYWYAGHDLHPQVPTQDGLYCDIRHYHMGLRRVDGVPKLLGRLWAERGIEAVQSALQFEPTAVQGGESSPEPWVLITGGAGFVGTNLAERLLSAGRRVWVFDNLSRPGVEQNLRWLQSRHGDRLKIQIADVRDAYAIETALQQADQVFHLAAQVAVTTSLKNPLHDFEVNVRGTLNLLEAMRKLENPPSLVFTSTNKVYGALEDVALCQCDDRYQPLHDKIHLHGISEDRPLSFHSPYGCSKGAAEQYVLDYARTFGLSAVVLRMSCIYGMHQFGTEDQGWVAHFLIRAIEEQPICIYGDGMQVRDVLFVEDLVNAFLLAQDQIHTLAGQAFNIGGGTTNALSLLKLITLIEALHGKAPVVHFDRWRAGDQRYYVSDTRKFSQATGWVPQVSLQQGIRRLSQWLLESRGAAVPLGMGKEG